MINSKLSEAVALLGQISPKSQGAGTAVSGWVSIAQAHQIMALVQVGAFGASATVDAKVQQATSNAGAGAKDVSGKAITQLLAAGGNDRQVEINLRPQDLDTEGGFDYVQLSITVGTAATLIAGAIFAAMRFEPASDSNAASVAQVV